MQGTKKIAGQLINYVEGPWGLAYTLGFGFAGETANVERSS
jgi:hypothetical protein